MPNLPAPALLVAPDDLVTLRRWANATTTPATLALRARILLLAADGWPTPTSLRTCASPGRP